MQLRSFIAVILISCLSCKDKKQEERFDKIRWATKNDMDYPYRDKMLKDLMTNHRLHGLKKDSLVSLLGQPSRSDTFYLFYTIEQQRLGFFPLHTKTLVFKFTKDTTVEWVKIHE